MVEAHPTDFEGVDGQKYEFIMENGKFKLKTVGFFGKKVEVVDFDIGKNGLITIWLLKKGAIEKTSYSFACTETDMKVFQRAKNDYYDDEEKEDQKLIIIQQLQPDIRLTINKHRSQLKSLLMYLKGQTDGQLVALGCRHTQKHFEKIYEEYASDQEGKCHGFGIRSLFAVNYKGRLDFLLM